MDYYQILGVRKDASDSEIKKAYHKLAHQFHPDKKTGDEKKFKEINQAYQVLSDRKKREQYDKFGHVFEGQGSQNAEGFAGFDPRNFWSDFKGQTAGFDFETINLEDLFENLFSFGQSPKKKKMNQGQSIEVELSMNLEDVLQSFKKKLNLIKKIVCPRCAGSGGEPNTKIKECFSCRGTGQVQQMKRTILGTITRYIVCPECKGEGTIPKNPCNVCKGEGRINGEEEIEISIPAGVDTGQTLKFSGKGDAGKRGGRSGDLYVRILVKPHAIFRRKGDDIYLNCPISFSQAVLGDKIEIPTLEKKTILLKVPAGVEFGKIFRISGKGIPHFNGWGQGDMYVKLNVKIPKKLNKKQKELLEKLKEEGI